MTEKAEGDSAGTGRGKPKLSAILIAAFTILLAYCCVFSLIVKATRSESLPMPLGFGMAVVLTGSMEPTLSTNDLVIVAPAKDYRVDDIIVYSTGGTPVIHRLTEIDQKNGIAVTKGDANNAEDDPISVSRIKGRLLFSIPGVGIVFRFIKSVPGIIMILILLFTLFYLSVRAKEQDSEETEHKQNLQHEIETLRAELGEKAAAAEDDTAAKLEEIRKLREQLGLTDEDSKKD